MNRMISMKKVMCGVVCLMFLTIAAQIGYTAQADSGQFWVKLFEDRDNDGTLDEGEPPITRGVAVSLFDAAGIVVQTLDLDVSPYAARGEVGFQYLAPGDYTLQVTSSEWTATTPTSFTQTIRADDVLPTLVEVGVRRDPSRAALDERFTTEEWIARSGRARLAFAALGATLVAGGMFAGGIIIIGMMARRSSNRQRKQTTPKWEQE